MTKDEFLAISGEKYEKLQELNQIDDFYKYEKGVWRYLGHALSVDIQLEKQMVN